ncbi:restriction endonuclease subunit S [Acinetobacter baumannii]|nr:restriction endonuclease subunit S [Acinetobacter baumannii]
MSQFELPEGWVTAELDKLTSDISYRYTVSSTDHEIGPKLLRITDIQDNQVNWSTVPFCEIDPAKFAKYELKEHDLLFARTGATVGKSFLVRGTVPPAVYASYLIRVRSLSIESVKYLSFFFKSPNYWQQITEFSAGIGQPNVNGTKLKSLVVPVPPLAEQQVIADKLDTLLAQVESIKTRLERIFEILKQFRQSVLAAAVSGKLTEEWRKLNDEGGFSETTWEGILRDKKNSFKRGPFGSALKKSMFVESGFKVYEQYCPINDDCTYARYYITPEKFEEMKAFEVLDGDFLISCSGVSLGRITQVPFGSERGIINQALLRVRLNNQLYNDDFFKLVFRSPSFQKDLFENSTGSAIPNLKGVKELKAMVIPLPSLNEQEKIVELVNHHFEAISGIDECVRSALDRVNSLTQSILAKAFRGELTADWREANPELISGENSAEALLKRIKAERESAKPTTKRGRAKT